MFPAHVHERSWNFHVIQFSCFKFLCKKFFVVGSRHENFFYSTLILKKRLPRSQAHRPEWNTSRWHGRRYSQRACCVCGYHVSKEIWKVALGEFLACEREPRNAADRYNVVVKKYGMIIGHLPRKVSEPSLDCRYRKRAIWRHSKQPAALRSMHVWKCADHYYFS